MEASGHGCFNGCVYYDITSFTSLFAPDIPAGAYKHEPLVKRRSNTQAPIYTRFDGFNEVDDDGNF